MIVLISGASHTGKTLLAQKLLEKYTYPVLSIDLLKMGLIRSNNTSLTPEEDKKLQQYLWPIIREIAKTAIENKQNLIIEGAYIPFDWKKDFDFSYLKEIQFYCLIMTPNYIQNHFSDIKNYANIIEKRLDDSWFTKEIALKENQINLELCKQNNCRYILIDNDYNFDLKNSCLLFSDNRL